jgi:C-terminal peptidase prc
MKLKTLKLRLFFLPLIILGTSWNALAEKPTEKQYWAGTEMNFQFLRQVFLKDCSGDLLVACVQALNVGAASMTPPAVFATDKEAAEKSPVLGRKLQSFGSLGLYEYVKDVSKSSLPQKMKRVQKARQLQIDGVKALGRNQVTVDIGGILLATKSAMLGKDPGNEPLLAGEMSNAYLAAAMDPHTHVDPQQEMNDRMSQADQSFSGIGVVISESAGQVVVQQMIEGGAAVAAGLQAKDIFLAINGESVVGKDVSEVSSKVRGPEGTTVVLTIERKGHPLTLQVKRAKVFTPNVSSKMVSDMGPKIGYIKLESFMDENGCTKITSAITDLIMQGAQGFIIDLRGNGGGLVTEATCIGALFLGRKLIVQEKTMDGKLTESLSGERSAMTNLPMATLIDSNSASASEILSGALQDHQRSLIIGDRSFGKATVQAVTPWTSTLMKAETVARFYQPSGRTNQIVGITPDIAVEPFPGATEDDKFALREADLYTNAVPALGKPWVQPRPKLMSEIRACMKAHGRADRLYAAGKDRAIPPDYRLLAAEEALECTGTLGK